MSEFSIGDDVHITSTTSFGKIAKVIGLNLYQVELDNVLLNFSGKDLRLAQETFMSPAFFVDSLKEFNLNAAIFLLKSLTVE